MNENGQNMNSQEYTYTGNQGQVFAPAPERRQQTTTIDGVNRFGRYVNNEYMANPQPANTGYNSGLSSQIAAAAEKERLAMEQAAADEATVIVNPAPAVAPAPAAPIQQQVQQPQVQSAAPVQNVAPQVAPAQNAVPQTAPVQSVAPQTAPAPQPVQPQVQPVAPSFEASPVAAAAPQPVQPQVQPVAPRFEASPVAAPAQSAAPQAVAPAQSSVSQAASPAQSAAPVQQPAKPVKAKKEKKEKPIGIKLLLMAACGLVFGAVAGGVILVMLKFLPNKLQLVNNQPGIVASEKPSEEPGPVTSEVPSEETGTVLVSDNDGSIEGTTVTESMTVAEIAEACMPSVVIINTKVDYNYYGYVTEAAASGTGVIVGQNDENLFIATNYHVVQDAKEISVQFCDSSTANAEVKGKKVSNDLAVITVKMNSLGESTKGSIKLATVGTSADLVVGQECVAIGNALGYGQSVTYGVISALNREMTTESGETSVFIQTDAAINHGNSGGALLNMKGQLIGINSAKLDGSSVESMGYAIPIDTARPIIEKLIEKKELEELPAEQQSYFGISGYTVKSGSRTNSGVPIPVGIYVRSVAPGSPAENAGIQAGDIITEFEGESIVSTAELMQYLASYPSGAEVTVTYKRLENGQFATYDAKVRLEEKVNNNRP